METAAEVLALARESDPEVQPDSLLLAVYSEPIRILESATGEELARIPWRVNHGGIWSLAFSPDGRHLAIPEKENIGIWDVLAGKFAHTFRSHRLLDRC